MTIKNNFLNSTRISECELLERVDPKNYASREKWELETVAMIRLAEESKTVGLLSEYVKYAKEEGWFGSAYPSGGCSPYGLVNYLYELYSRQIWVLHILPLTGGTLQGRRYHGIPEFTSKERAIFYEWIPKYDAKTAQIGFCDRERVQKSSMEIIRKVWQEKKDKIKNEKAKLLLV